MVIGPKISVKYANAFMVNPPVKLDVKRYCATLLHRVLAGVKRSDRWSGAADMEWIRKWDFPSSTGRATWWR